MIYAPQLIINPYKEVYLPTPSIGLRGYFTVELIEKATGRIKQRLEFRNLITNAGVDFMFSNSGAVNSAAAYAGVGTGSTTPAATQTALVTEITPASTNRTTANASVAATTGYTSGSPDYVWAKRVFSFATTQGNGNLTEIALFSAVTAGTMFCRQLFKDSGGTATTVIKTSADELRVTYEIRIYPDMNDGSGTVTLSAVGYAFASRVCAVGTGGPWEKVVAFASGANLSDNNYMGFVKESSTLVTRTTSWGSGTDPSSHAMSSYTNGNFYRDYSIVYESTAANFTTGIGCIGLFNPFSDFSRNPGYQFSITPTKIPKDGTKKLTLLCRNTITHNV